ncbi:MAG: hypothetical protein ACKVOO_03915 [Burkholderiaceae bacterium]
MFLRAGLISMALLLASRLTGLVRETAQAAALGLSADGDIVVLMLTLPDLLVNVFFLGGLAYIALPLWAAQTPAGRAASQRRMAWWCVGGGLLLALAIALGQHALVRLLAPGLGAASSLEAARGLLWVALLLPFTALASVWYCRLQFERDFVGLYGWNLLVNAVLIGTLYAMASVAGRWPLSTVFGAALVLALLLRLAWQFWRLQRLQLPAAAQGSAAVVWPSPQGWLWAAVAAGLPLTLPLIARSVAAGAGDGALSAFNYAFKLIDLPHSLAVQVVATLAFPAVSRAVVEHMARVGTPDAVRAPGAAALTVLPDLRAIRSAYLFAWALACAGACALASQSQAIALLLFGWGRMQGEQVAMLAGWASAGAWSLLPQALISVTAVVMASSYQLRALAWGFAFAAATLVAWGMLQSGAVDGAAAMLALTAVQVLLALGLMWCARRQIRSSLPLAQMAAVAGVAVALAVLFAALPPAATVWGWFFAATAAAVVLATAFGISPDMRAALKR